MEVKSLTERGINSFQLKFIGVLFMTIDHIAKYTLMIPMGSHIFNILGRIAAPMFLYLITVSAQHTRSKPKFAFRLLPFTDKFPRNTKLYNLMTTKPGETVII